MTLIQSKTESEISYNPEPKETSASRRPCNECGTLVRYGYARCEKCRKKARNQPDRDVKATQCLDCSATFDSMSHGNKGCVRCPNCRVNKRKEKDSERPRCKDCDQPFRGPKGCVRCSDCRARRQGGQKQTQAKIGTTANETTNNAPKIHSTCQTCNQLVPCTCVLTKCAEPKCRERFLVPWKDEYGARCAKCRKQKEEETRNLEYWKRLKQESAAEVEYQSLDRLLRFLGSLEERKVRFSGCYWLVADPQLLGHDRAMAVARYMTQIGAIRFDLENPHPFTSRRCRDGELLFSCLCTPLQTGKGSCCGGFINILVSEDDTTHPLGIDGQRVTIRILHPTV